MIKIIHISDTHYHSNVSDNSVMKPILSGIWNEYFMSGNNYLLVTGDLVDDGHEEQYRNFKNDFVYLNKRTFICPGNHDYGPSGIFYDRQCAERFDTLATTFGYDFGYISKEKPIVKVLRDPDDNGRVMMIGLNGCLETTNLDDFSCGAIGNKQLEVLNAIVNNPAARHVPKLVYMHFHPFMMDDGTMMLRDAEALLEVVRGKIDVLCFGHKHEQKRWDTVPLMGTTCGEYYGIPAILAAGKLMNERKVYEITFAGNKFIGAEEAIIPEVE